MESKLLPLVIFQTAALAGALGQLLYKQGATETYRARVQAQLMIFFGMVLYIGVTVLFVFAYRLGGEVSILYPTYGATFVWALLLARFFSGEKVTLTKVTGTLFVIGGICLVTF